MLLFFYNPLLIICVLILILSIVRGARKGILKIIYGMISWILLIIFVNMVCGYVSDYLNVNTSMPTIMQQHISDNLHERYESNEEESGTGEDAVLRIIPDTIREKIDETIETSVDTTIKFIAVELSATAIRGIATIISVIAGILLLFILNKLVNFIGNLPGVEEVNMILGSITGFCEGVLIIWFCMFLADCFPTSAFGTFILENIAENDLLNYVYQINLIEQIIGI